MTTHQPNQPMNTTHRDPHLPPPAVCDWLLEQSWQGEIPETRIDYQGGNPTGIAGSALFGWQQAYVDIGADAGGRIFLDSDALDILRKDHASRKAALEEKRQAWNAADEDDLARKVQRQQERACEAES